MNCYCVQVEISEKGMNPRIVKEYVVARSAEMAKNLLSAVTKTLA